MSDRLVGWVVVLFSASVTISVHRAVIKRFDRLFAAALAAFFSSASASQLSAVTNGEWFGLTTQRGDGRDGFQLNRTSLRPSYDGRTILFLVGRVFGRFFSHQRRQMDARTAHTHRLEVGSCVSVNDRSTRMVPVLTST